MQASRLPFAVLLAGTLAPFAVPTAWSVFLCWLLVGTGLALALRAPYARRGAAVALATLAALVTLTLVGSSVTLGRAGAGWGGATWESFAMVGGFAAVWLPSGIFLAMSGKDPPARIAAVGTLLILLWVAVFGGILLAEAGAFGKPMSPPGEAHILILLPGTTAVTGVLAWRIARPPRLRPVGDDAGPAAAPQPFSGARE
jgi:hypothetical protein